MQSLKYKLSLLHSKQLRHLFIARTISIFGDMLTPIALAFAVLSFTHSASALGIVLAARALPSVILMLFGGVVGDRYPRKIVMIVSNVIGFLSQGAIGLLLLLGIADLWSVSLLTAVRGVTSSFFNPSSTGAISQVAPLDRKQETFSLFAIAGNIAEIAGPSLAGVFLVKFSPGWLLLVDSITFLLSAIFIATGGSLGKPKGAKKTMIFQQLSEGFKYVKQKSWLMAVILSASMFQLFLLSSLNVLGPVVTKNSLGGAPDWAIISTSLGIGSIVGSILTLYFKPAKPLLIGFILLLLGSGPSLFLLSVPAPTMFIAVSEFFAGVTISFFSTLESTAISRLVPDELLSRVDSINRFGSMALKPLGMALVGPLSAVIGLRETLIITGCISLLSVIWPLTLKSVRKLSFDEEDNLSDSKVSQTI